MTESSSGVARKTAPATRRAMFSIPMKVMSPSLKHSVHNRGFTSGASERTATTCVACSSPSLLLPIKISFNADLLSVNGVLHSRTSSFTGPLTNRLQGTASCGFGASDCWAAALAPLARGFEQIVDREGPIWHRWLGFSDVTSPVDHGVGKITRSVDPNHILAQQVDVPHDPGTARKVVCAFVRKTRLRLRTSPRSTRFSEATGRRSTR